MSDSIIKLNDDNKRAFKCLRDCGWEIAAAQPLRQTAIVIDAGCLEIQMIHAGNYL